MKKSIGKTLGSVFFILMFLSVFVLIKTELRKWTVFEGESSSANTFLFWISLGSTALFGFLGVKVWPEK